MTNEREIVLDTLLEIIEKNQYSHILEKAVLDKYDYLESNQKAFIKILTEGTLETVFALDKVINQVANTKTSKQKPLIRNLLRMSTYQILFLDKVPDSAAINEAVKLAGKRGFRTLSGFVNGTLRNISRRKEELRASVCDEDMYPEWMVKHFTDNYGKENAHILMAKMNEPHPVTVRIRKPMKDMSPFMPSAVLDNAYTVKKGISLSDIEGYGEGAFVVQDISSQMVCHLAMIKPQDLVVDVCAAPGGKTIHAYDMGARVISRDVSDSKVSLIEENLRRCKISEGVETQIYDATVIDDNLIEKADVVLCDVPCSGLGVIGKKADIRIKTAQEDLTALLSIQEKIVDAVWRYVKPGGILMYSTCTLNPAENQDRVKNILEQYPFKLVEEKQFIPGIDPTDGFYIAKLIRV